MMRKRWLALLLAGLMAASVMAGCGGKSDADNESGESTTAQTGGGTDGTEPQITDATGETGETGGSTVSGGEQNPGSTKQNTSTTKKAAASTTKSSGLSADLDPAKAPMPTREIKNKTLKVYGWAKLTDHYGTKKKTLPNMFKQEFDVKFEEDIVTYDEYWSTLNKRKAADKMPDVVHLPNWTFYPKPIVDNLIQPLDDIIDFNNPLWNSTRTVRDFNKWKGKTYVAFQSEYLDTWMFFNKKMFRDAGKKDPQYYWEQDDWTYDRMVELANQMVVKNRSTQEITQWGLVQQTCDLIATTGLELVSGDGKGGYVNNLADPKVAKLMNALHSLGDGGSKAYYRQDQRTGFKSGKVAMIATQIFSATLEFNDLRLAGNLGWVPMPKQDKNSPYYHQTATNPGYAIAEGASNVEAAALFIEYFKWWELGSEFCYLIPDDKQNAADIRYKSFAEEPQKDKMLTADEIAYTKKILAKNYKNVSQMWQSWLGSGEVPGFTQVLNGSQWSTVLKEQEAPIKSLLDLYIRK